MIIIGEKINGSIPSMAKAIAARDEEWIKMCIRDRHHSQYQHPGEWFSDFDPFFLYSFKWYMLINIIAYIFAYCKHNPEAENINVFGRMI